MTEISVFPFVAAKQLIWVSMPAPIVVHNCIPNPPPPLICSGWTHPTLDHQKNTVQAVSLEKNDQLQNHSLLLLLVFHSKGTESHGVCLSLCLSRSLSSFFLSFSAESFPFQNSSSSVFSSSAAHHLCFKAKLHACKRQASKGNMLFSSNNCCN